MLWYIIFKSLLSSHILKQMILILKGQKEVFNLQIPPRETRMSKGKDNGNATHKSWNFKYSQICTLSPITSSHVSGSLCSMAASKQQQLITEMQTCLCACELAEVGAFRLNSCMSFSGMHGIGWPRLGWAGVFSSVPLASTPCPGSNEQWPHGDEWGKTVNVLW